ncbi:hypothetical protein BC834DRAFT_966044 [Gloeopeniophorella convolvens]|nr:hypothetical protein BC834DRAFT_966044 [Gloeopeniophorella convolvens]
MSQHVGARAILWLGARYRAAAGPWSFPRTPPALTTQIRIWRPSSFRPMATLPPLNQIGFEQESVHHNASLTTLNPRFLRRRDYLRLSGRKTHKVTIRGDLHHSLLSNDVVLKYALNEKRLRVPFPEGAKGFLYFRLPEGEVRFRVTGADNPKACADGYDLLMPDGKPWKMGYEVLGRRKKQEFTPLRALLRRDELARGRDLETLEQCLEESKIPTISRLEDPFLMRFGVHTVNVKVLHNDTEVTARIHFPRPNAYLKGRGIVCFERSTLPEHSDPRDRFVVLRLLKVEVPIRLRNTTDGDQDVALELPRPKAGNLLFKSPGKIYATRIDADSLLARAVRPLLPIPTIPPKK